MSGFFLVGAGELFADVWALFLHGPVVVLVVVVAPVGADAFVALDVAAGEAHVVGDEGGVGVVVVVFVLEDVGFFPLVVLLGFDGGPAVAEGRGEPVAGRGGVEGVADEAGSFSVRWDLGWRHGQGKGWKEGEKEGEDDGKGLRAGHDDV